MPLDFVRDEGPYRCWLAAQLGPVAEGLVLDILSPAERARYYSFPSRRRQDSFLLGRCAAKRALAPMLARPLPEISIGSGVFGFPVIDGGSPKQVAISHTEAIAVAVAFPEQHPVGIDIELRRADSSCIVEQMTQAERYLARSGRLDSWQLWSAKESLAKTLRAGLTLPLEVMEVASVVDRSEVNELRFKNFTQYRALSCDIGAYVLSICVPRKSALHADVHREMRARLLGLLGERPRDADDF